MALFLHGIQFIKDDVLSCAQNQQLRPDAVAVAIQHGIRNKLHQVSPSIFSNEICVIDPNVAYMLGYFESFRLGPVDLMTKATKIFVPIADFSREDIINSVLHWTLLILEKDTTTSNPHRWFQPIHLDSLNRADSVNQKMAEKISSLIISGLSPSSSSAMSTTTVKPIVYPSTPRQGNALDCGIFVALGVCDVVRMMMLKEKSDDKNDEDGEEKQQLYLAGKKSIFYDSSENKKLIPQLNWSYNQEVATQFKQEVYEAMCEELKKLK